MTGINSDSYTTLVDATRKSEAVARSRLRIGVWLRAKAKTAVAIGAVQNLGFDSMIGASFPEQR